MKDEVVDDCRGGGRCGGGGAVVKPCACLRGGGDMRLGVSLMTRSAGRGRSASLQPEVAMLRDGLGVGVLEEGGGAVLSGFLAKEGVRSSFSRRVIFQKTKTKKK